MSDTPPVDANAAGKEIEAGAARPPDSGAAKPPARPSAEVRADIERERAELERSFATLRGDLDDVVDAGRQRAAGVRRRALVVVPAAAAALAAALFLRGRRSRDRR
jgi:hypothetical protein